MANPSFKRDWQKPAPKSNVRPIMKFLLTSIWLLTLSFSAIAKDKEKLVTIQGVVGVGELDSSIDSLENDDGVIFLTQSKEGDKIFSVCKADDICQVTGVVTGKYPTFISVKKVLLIKRAQ